MHLDVCSNFLSNKRKLLAMFAFCSPNKLRIFGGLEKLIKGLDLKHLLNNFLRKLKIVFTHILFKIRSNPCFQIQLSTPEL